jgi:hypothetical protein
VIAIPGTDGMERRVSERNRSHVDATQSDLPEAGCEPERSSAVVAEKNGNRRLHPLGLEVQELK